MSDSDAWILSHLRPELPRLFLGAGALVVTSFVNFRTGAQLKKACELAPGTGSGPLLGSLALFGVGAVAGSIRTFIFDTTAEKLRASIATEVFAARLSAEPSAPAAGSGNEASSIAMALDGDVTLCAEIVPKLQNMVRFSCSILGGTFAMFRASWKLSAAVWPLLAAGALRGSRAGAKQAGKSAQQLATAREDAMSFAEERLQHANIVRWCSRVEFEAAAFREKYLACVVIASKAAKGRGIAHLCVDLAGKGVLIGLCSIGSRLVQRGELTAGELTSFFFHAGFLGLGIYGFVGLVPELAVAREAARRLNAGNRASDNDTEGSAAAATVTQRPCASVCFDNVGFTYPSGKNVLDGFSLDIPAGSSCALVGPSGCGKSTVVSLLLRDHDGFTGNISIDGCSIRDVSRKSVRNTLGVAPQQAVLLGKSVSNAIAYGATSDAKVAQSDIEAAAQASCAHDFVTARRDGYDSPVGAGGQLLSGGERQRVASARALLRRAPVLVFDEPTSALDSTTAAAWAKAVLAPQPNRPTILAITHSLVLIRSCDSIAVLSESGRVVQHGTFSDLIADSAGPLALIMKAGDLEDDVMP
mmetsp:Transcript_13505/g.26571  ORF Transcript_13505/g.26571 Transcript_13505/m.26571 type:complete len:586 (-) Transcript_13505:40-1797(-)